MFELLCGAIGLFVHGNIQETFQFHGAIPPSYNSISFNQLVNAAAATADRTGRGVHTLRRIATSF